MGEASEVSKPDIAALVRSLERCKSRMETISGKHKSIAALLLHESEIGNRPPEAQPARFDSQSYWRLCDFQGPQQGHEAHTDADGVKTVTYPGAKRIAYLFGRQLQDESELAYSETIAAVRDASKVLGRLLTELPIEAKAIVWREWPHNYRYLESATEGIWVNAVFELAFQKRKYSGLAVERYIWDENKKVDFSTLAEWKANPNSLDYFDKMFGSLVEHAGDPPAYWYSWIEDIASASITALDFLIGLVSDFVDSAYSRGAEPLNEIIERLQDSPANTKLNDDELAQVKAFLKQPLSLATIQTEKKSGSGFSPTLQRQEHLKLIVDYNDGLKPQQYAKPIGLEKPQSSFPSVENSLRAERIVQQFNEFAEKLSGSSGKYLSDFASRSIGNIIRTAWLCDLLIADTAIHEAIKFVVDNPPEVDTPSNHWRARRRGREKLSQVEVLEHAIFNAAFRLLYDLGEIEKGCTGGMMLCQRLARVVEAQSNPDSGLLVQTDESPSTDRETSKPKRSTTNGEARTPEISDEEILASLTPAVQLAWKGYLLVEPNLPANSTDDQAYRELSEQEHALADNLPGVEAWKRYVREARRALGLQKNQPRAGRELSGSVVRAEDI